MSALLVNYSENLRSEDQCYLMHRFFYNCKSNLKETLSKLQELCDQVPSPRGKVEYIDYFCGRRGSAEELDATKTKRSNLFKAINDLIFLYSNIVDGIKTSKHEFREIAFLEETIKHYISIREIICSNVLLQNHLISERLQLEIVFRQLDLLCEEVEFPKNELNYIHFFCGKSGTIEELQFAEHRRKALYKHTASLLRFYIGIADEMEAAGYTSSVKSSIEKRVDYYIELRETIRCSVLLQTRLVKARAKLDSALEKVQSLCVKVEFPRDVSAHILYFCGKRGEIEELKLKEVMGKEFSKAVIELASAYMILNEEMESAGYSISDAERIKSAVDFYTKLRYQMIQYKSYDNGYI